MQYKNSKPIEENKTIQQKIIFYTLTLLGYVPFAILTYLHTQTQNQDYWLNILIAYSCIIMSFTAGVQWGMMLCRRCYSIPFTFCTCVSAVSFALIAWTLLFNDTYIREKLIVLILGFIGLWVVDFVLYLNTVVEKWYLQLRSVISIAIILILLYSV